MFLEEAHGNLLLYCFISLVAEPINVGWGKKETQFHGSLGKAAAQSKEKEVYISVLGYIIDTIYLRRYILSMVISLFGINRLGQLYL